MHFKYSEFDSLHLEQKIACAALSHIDRSTVDGLRNELSELGCDLGFLKSETLPRELMAEGLSDSGLEISDIKLEFESRIPRNDDVKFKDFASSELMLSSELQDPAFVEEIFYSIADRSRFRFYFGREKARRLYRAWLDGLQRDSTKTKWCMSRGSDPRRCAGLIVAKIDAFDQCAHWEMVGVSEDFRGRGVGKAIAHRLMQDHLDAGIHRIRVSTQVDNENAISFYQSLGFQLVKTIYQFHLWPSQKK